MTPALLSPQLSSLPVSHIVLIGLDLRQGLTPEAQAVLELTIDQIGFKRLTKICLHSLLHHKDYECLSS